MLAAARPIDKRYRNRLPMFIIGLQVGFPFDRNAHVLRQVGYAGPPVKKDEVKVLGFDVPVKIAAH